MITVGRVGGDPRDAWIYADPFIHAAAPMRADGWFNGSLLRVHAFEPEERRWIWDGHRLGDGVGVRWSREGSLVWREGHGLGQAHWFFDGSLLRPHEDATLDEWRATRPVPLPVILFAAGLL